MVEAGSVRAVVNVLINHMASSAEVGGPPRLKPQVFKAEVGGTPRLKPNFSFSDMWVMSNASMRSPLRTPCTVSHGATFN